jgi:ABC-2 type transport system ATP-binding protein
MTSTDSIPTTASAVSSPPDHGPLAIDLRGVRRSFGSVHAVDGIDLAVRPGQVVALLGPNGAGKTTTIDLLLGLARPDAGTVSVLGRSPARAVAEGRVSAVMQTGGLLKDLTVRETVDLTASFFRTPRGAVEVLARAGLTDVATRRVGRCSGGEQQRLRFALALLPDPDVIVLDEPTTGMDVAGRRGFWNALRVDAERGRTIVFATHHLEEVDAFADRVVLLSGGRVVADGSAAHVRNLASGRVVASTLPGHTVAQRDALAAIPGVGSVEYAGDRVHVLTSDSDAVARHLLTATAAHDLEVTTRGLEDAFLTLTTSGSPA